MLTEDAYRDASAPPAVVSEAPDGEPETIRVLLVEDDEDDYLITADLLAERARLPVRVEWAQDYARALAAIHEQSHDVYLIDYRLGRRTGLELIREGFASRPVAPVIMLTGQPSEEINLEATALGVTEFLSKRDLDAVVLERAIRHAISHQKAERHALAARANNEGIWDWDLATNRVYSSPRLNAIFGLGGDALELDLKGWLGLVAPEDLERVRDAVQTHLDGRTASCECTFRIRHRDGSWHWVDAHGLATRDADGRPIRLAGSLTDSTDRHRVQERLEHEALHDTLTGLPNRTLFVDRVDQALGRAGREPTAGCALLFLDLDGFKQINDSLSHAVGDRVLVAFAERIAASLRPGDTVARLGGDEFTVLLEGIAAPEEATVITERILDSLRHPFSIEGSELFIGTSIGIALGNGGLDSEELISAADLAMYDAKRRGRGRCAMFDEKMHRRVSRRLARRDELRHVIEHALLEVHYQPIIGLGGGRIMGVEALVRWPSERAPLETTEVISIAQEIGLANQLGEQVMRDALAALAGWRQAGLAGPELWVSVNISTRQISDAGLAEQLHELIADSDLPASALRLELDEATLMTLERSEALTTALLDEGIGLHVDDFGTGCSSITTLHRMPIRALKIERGLVAGIGEAGNRAVAGSVVALAHSCDAAAIASGIESEPQRAWLTGLGCDAGQGTHLAAVREGSGIAALLAQ